MKPSPPYLGLVLAATNQLQQFIARGCRFSPRNSDSESDDESDVTSADDDRVTVRSNDSGLAASVGAVSSVKE